MRRPLLLLLILIAFSCQREQENNTDNEQLISSSDTITKPDNPLPESVYVKEGNIYGVYSGGKEKKLTFTGNDTQPFLLKKSRSVLFIRMFPNSAKEYKHIMSVNLDDLIENMVAEKIPSTSETFIQIQNLTISGDENYLYFITDKGLKPLEG